SILDGPLFVEHIQYRACGERGALNEAVDPAKIEARVDDCRHHADLVDGRRCQVETWPTGCGLRQKGAGRKPERLSRPLKRDQFAETHAMVERHRTQPDLTGRFG